MKITNWGIVFILIMIPFWVTLYVKDMQTNQAMDLSNQYNQALDTATQDAADVLMTNANPQLESDYTSLKFTNANREEAIETFIKTLSVNYSVQDEMEEGVLASYIPIIGIVDYQGVYFYAMEENTETSENLPTHTEMPMKPYTYHDQAGNIVSFSLDDYVVVYDQDQDEWLEGFRHELEGDVSFSLLADEDRFETIRRQTIIDTIREDLSYYINRHNTYAKRYGVNYTFTLPTMTDEEWENTIDDIGFFSFIQGVPLKADHTFNNFAFGGSRIVKNDVYYGAEIDGVRYYYRESEEDPAMANRVFTSRKDAAANGYFPLIR